MQQIFLNFFYILISAVLLVWLFKRLNLPPILAYLAVGIMAGDFGFAWLSDYEHIHFVAELGIVFLLFSLGLEFSIPKLVAMRHVVFGLGFLQMLVTTVVVMLILRLIGVSWLGGFAIASVVALSSTAIVVKQLSGSGGLSKREGQLAIGILLFQDIAVVPLLIALPLLAGNGGGNLWGAIGFALGKGIIVCTLLLSIGKWILPRIFNEVAQARTDELFVLTTILVALIAGALTHAFGLSMALGAFLAGMMLGESQYRHQLEADIRPFRDVLMGLFFVTVGMQLNMGLVVEQFHYVMLGLIALILIKGVLIYWLTVRFGETKPTALATALMLSQMGEFSFVLIALAQSNKLLQTDTTSLLLAIGVLSMAITPFMIDRASYYANKVATKCNWRVAENELKQQLTTSKLTNHVVILGFGRVGQTTARFLKTEAIPYVAVDSDSIRVREAQAAGERIKFGDAKSKDILRAANVQKARLVIITFADKQRAKAIVETIKQLHQGVKILVRMRDDKHLAELKAAGVTEVVPETLEASLMLVSHVLMLSGVPVKRIIRRVQNERKNRYGLLHGYFPGDAQELNSTTLERLEHLHAVAISDDAFAKGKTLAQLALDKKRVDVMGLRRGEREISAPDEGLIIEAHDILVIRGKPRRIERAERFLLEGD